MVLPMPLPPLSFLHSLHLNPFLSPSDRCPLVRRGDLAIRMGGGPRTFPGGVSKWQWKRMQAKKAKQLLKARLARERQLYEMRKRAELRQAADHLERPWDPATAAIAAPNLLSVAADDQLKSLADRFHRPGGVDLWNDRDGPQVFASPATGTASARFFPKNAVHSVQPYALLAAGGERAKGVRRNDHEEVEDGVRGNDHEQGVCENAAEDEVDANGELTLEFGERDGVWELTDAFDEGDDDASDLGWNGDDFVSDYKGMGDAGFGPEWEVISSRGNGRKGSAARWKVANDITAIDNGERDWNDDGFLPDFEGARQRSGRNGRKSAAGRWKPLNAGRNNINSRDRIGGGSFSDSEANHSGFKPERRARSIKETRNGMGRWRLSNVDDDNAHVRDWMDYDFDTDFHDERDGLEPKWNARRNGTTRSESRWGRSKAGNNVNANNGERVGGYMKGNNGDGRDWVGGDGFVSDLEEPTWKPRKGGNVRKNRGGMWKSENGMDGGRGERDSNSRRFRRGGNAPWRDWSSDAGRQKLANYVNTSREEHGGRGRRHRTGGNRGLRFKGDGQSLRPTSELYSSWGGEKESNEM